MGRRSLAGLRYMSCRSGEDSDLQRALGTVSPGWLTLARTSQRTMAKTRVELVNASKLFKSKIHLGPDALSAATTFWKARSLSSRE